MQAEKFEVEMTQDDIDTAILSSERCPVANAIRRWCILRGYTDMIAVSVNVGCTAARVLSHWYDLSPNAIAFIRKFDRKVPVQPISFVLTKWA